MSDGREGDNRGTNGRRSSFVPPKEGESDYVPSLPPVGSAPIPAAQDVNYFPSVKTGTPELAQPAPPARLIVPTRQSLTEEQIATRFAESADMSSMEQIAFLDSQMTLREADIATATDFYSRLLLANPREGAPLLAELKAQFGDLSEVIRAMELLPAHESSHNGVEAAVSTDASGLAVAADSFIDGVLAPTPEPVSSAIEAAVQAPISQAAAPTEADDAPSNLAYLGRYRGWSSLVTIAVAIAAIIPTSFAVFTPFGSPVPDHVNAFLGVAGVFVLVAAVVISLPIVLLARTTAFRNGISWRGAYARVLGTGGGNTLAIVVSVFIVLSVVAILFTVGHAIGTQLGAIDVVAQAASTLVPNGHLDALLVGVVFVIAAILASLPRRLFRAKSLALTGFTLGGPAVLILQGIAIAANTAADSVFSIDNIVVATAIVPLVVTLMVATESSIGTVSSRDDVKMHGLWLFIGLALGIAFSAWTLVDGFSNTAAAEVFVGANPVLHFVGGSTTIALIIAVVTVGIPTVLLVSLALRNLLMLSTAHDRATPPLLARIGVVLIAVALVSLEVLGVIPDLATVVPGLAFASVPVLVVTGILAGASITARRTIASGARIGLTALASALIVAGLAATTWSVPTLSSVYANVIGPVLEQFGLTGTIVYTLPVGLLIVSFVISLTVSSIGSRPPVGRE